MHKQKPKAEHRATQTWTVLAKEPLGRLMLHFRFKQLSGTVPQFND